MDQTAGRASLSLTASVAASIGASLCCTAPLLLVMAGLGGSWMVTLRAFEPFRPVFIGLAAVALVVAYRQIFRPAACEPDAECANPSVQQRRKALFWVVAVVVGALVTSPYFLPYLVS